MDIQPAIEFLATHHRAVLATRRSTGAVQLSPVVACARADGTVLISTQAGRAKARNVRRRPDISLCVMNDEFFGSWMQIDGEATVVELPSAMEGLIEYYRRISGEHPAWDEYRSAMQREGRVLLEITITKVTTP